MKSDDIAVPDIPEIQTVSPSSSLKDRRINITSEERASNSSDSTGSSPSDLRRRLEDLPSSDEFTLLTDRVAALGRRICHKREFLLKLHGAVDRIEESDEWEDTGDGPEGTPGAFRTRDARARRRARARLKNSPRRGDKAMMISRVAGCIAPSETASDNDNFNSAMPTEDRSDARDCNYSQLAAIEVPRIQSRPTSLSEPPTTRFYCDNDGGQCDVTDDAPFHTYRDAKWTMLRSASPFCISNVRPKKFGGYRPPSGVVVKNLSSGSESESANEANRDFSSADDGIGTPIVAAELSSPESKLAAVNGFAKKTPFVPASSDIARPISPNLLPSTSFRSDDPRCQMWGDTSLNFLDSVRASRDESATNIHNESEARSAFTSADVACNERASREMHDELLTKIFKGSPRTGNELWQVETEYEGSYDERDGMAENTLTFSSGRFVSRSAELLMNTCYEIATYGEPATKIRNGQIESDFDEGHDETGRTTNLSSCARDADNFRENSDGNFSSNIGDDVYLHRVTSAWTRETVDSPHLTEGAVNDITEEILSTSEPFGSEGHSRSSCTPNMYSQRETTSRSRNGTTDKCDQVITAITNVPTLALNSQDISRSISSGSRECSAMRPIDPHALIKALSNVSLRQAKEGKNGGAREREEDSRRQGKDTIDVTSGVSDFRAKGETWRVSRGSTSQSPPSRVPSRIPVRILSNKTAFSDGATEFPGYRVREKNGTNYEEAKLIDRSGASIVASGDSIHRRRSEVKASRSAFRNETYSSNQDFSTTEDTTEASRSNSRSVSHKNTKNIMRVVKSPWQSELKNDASSQSTRGESSKNAKANGKKVDEENSNGRIKSALETCDSPSFEAYSFRSNPPSQIERVVGTRRIGVDLEFRNKSSFDQDAESAKVAQSEDLVLQLRRTQEYSSFATKMSSSALNLSKEPKRKKRSQERCPFTISEAPGVLSSKCEVTTDCQISDESLPQKKTMKYDQVEGKETVHQLKIHPSITRLANAGLEATGTSCSVVHDRKEDQPPSKFRMKQIVLRIFPSRRRRRTSKQPRDDVKIPETTKVIYKNRACQEHSAANSCSEGSSTEVNVSDFDESSNAVSRHVAKSSPKFVCDENILKEAEHLVTISQEYPYRRYDRDDLWVQGIKVKKNGETLCEKDKADSPKENTSEDRYSIFLAKNLQSDKISKSNVNRDDSLKMQKRDASISDRMAQSAGESKKGIDADFVPEIEEIEEVLTDCFCLKLCRLITPSKYRLSIKEQVLLGRRKSGSLRWKRKE